MSYNTKALIYLCCVLGVILSGCAPGDISQMYSYVPEEGKNYSRPSDNSKQDSKEDKYNNENKGNQGEEDKSKKSDKEENNSKNK